MLLRSSFRYLVSIFDVHCDITLYSRNIRLMIRSGRALRRRLFLNFDIRFITRERCRTA
ncbi:hypothetical protein HanRHA438_Chr08g0359871 [Helianthus annuus]|nr:hypothetical protein HanRHA438_Chr08g0359871 [Helianthus annuus]